MIDAEPTIRDNAIPEPPGTIAECAVFELARIMSGTDAPPNERGRSALLFFDLAEETNMSGRIIITDVGQSVWKDLVARMAEELG